RPNLDDLLDRRESSAEVERLARTDAEVGRHVAMQRRLDESLVRIFAEPDSVPINLPAARRSPWMTRWIPLAAAAALLIASVGVYFVAFGRGGKDVLTPLYRQTVAAGFKPETVCTTDAEFANWCRAYMRQPIYPTSHPDGVEFVGWNIDQAIGPGTGVLL